jgi:flagellar hook-length control protein FliK
MQTGNIPPVAAAAAPAKTAKAPDTASWQAALTQAGEQATAAPATKPAQDTPAAAKPGTKDAAAVVSSILAAVEKTLAQPTKKPVHVAAESAAASPQKPAKEDKAAATPLAAAVTQPVLDTAIAPPDPGTAASAPDAVHATAAAVAKVLPQIPSTQAPASPDDIASARAQTTPATAISGHAATALPQLSTAAMVQVAVPPAATPTVAAVTPPAAPVVTPQTPAATHTAATGAAHEAVASISAAGSSKTSLSARSEDITITPAVATTKDDSADNQTTIQPAAFVTPPAHDTSMIQPPVPATASPTPPITQPSAAGLAAAVTAMHQSGQSGAVLRLDPPGLGDLSVHVALGQNGQVNVLFVPSTLVAATAIQNNLPSLGTALAQSGLTLGQAQVGGQFNQNAGQGGYQPPSPPSFTPTSTRFDPDTPTPSGLSAYA